MAKNVKNANPENTVPSTDGSATLEQVAALANMLRDELAAATVRILALESANEAKAGPKSERAMTEDDARRILALGDLEAAGHKEAAEKLNLSYGQIYSCRKGFTFKQIHKEVEMKLKEAAKEE
jgi:Arc/MetJ family transcription regulator